MKVLRCSQCTFPREKHKNLCKKCIHEQSNEAFVEALKSILLNKSLELQTLQKTLATRDIALLMLQALTHSNPLATQIQNPSVWPEVLREIRSHTKPNTKTCSAFRLLMDKGLYNEIVIPEECCECMYTAVTRGYSSYCNLAIGHLFYNDKEKLTSLFKRHLQTTGGRNSLLNYINFMLWISNSTEYMTPIASRRVIDILMEAVSPEKKHWILQELVLRPENYQFFLSYPSMLPGNYTETMFDYFQEFEGWWTFWNQVNTSVRKKIEFRNRALKDELMMVTWKPDRVRRWCLDIEESAHIDWFFGRDIRLTKNM
jgi:hypothetical protein